MHAHLGHKRLPSKLHVIAIVFNPLRFVSRYNLFKEFAQRVEASGEAELWIAELAFGDRPFEIETPGQPR